MASGGQFGAEYACPELAETSCLASASLSDSVACKRRNDAQGCPKGGAPYSVAKRRRAQREQRRRYCEHGNEGQGELRHERESFKETVQLSESIPHEL
jgi:hypothetical protein